MSNDFRSTFHSSEGVPRASLIALIERVMDAEVVGLERVTQGYVNEVYRASLSGSSVFVRIRRRGGVSFESEAWALRAARQAGVPVPEVHAVTELEAEERLVVMVLSAVPGRSLGDVWLELSETARQQVMVQVGVALRALHSVGLDGWGRRGEDGWPYPDWASRGVAEVHDREDDVAILQDAGLTESETDALLAVVREMRALTVTPPVLCHGDLGFDHIFVDDALSVTGLIDFGAWQGGPKALDVAVLSMYHPEVSLESLALGYQNVPFDADFHKRVLIEQVNTAMGFFAHDLRDGSADYAALALSGLRGTLNTWRQLTH